MDYVVNPPINSCPDSGSSGSGGTTVTSGLTYDGGTLNCLGINYNTNLNTVLSTINSTVCSLQSSVSTNTTNVSTNTTNISNLTTTVNNLNSSDFDISGITWSCLSPASASLNDALSAIEAKVCSLESSMSSTSCPDDGAGSGNVIDYWRTQYAKPFVHDKTNKFAYSSLGAETFTLAEGTTTDPTGCTKVTAGTTHTLPAGSNNKDVYVYNKFSEGIKKYILNAGDPAPAEVIDEVPLYKFTTDGAGNVSFDTDYREYSPYDESIFRSNTDLSSFITEGSIGQTELDLSSALLYDTVVTITDAKTLVHKSYVDSAISAIGSGIWTDNGGLSGIYYDDSPVGIGTSSPAAGTSAHIEGVLRYTDTNQAEGKWLQSDANGNASWQTLDISISVEDEGSPVGTFNTFNFIGAGVNAVDAGGGKIDVTISGTVSTFNDLADVAVASSLTYDTLFYDGANWVNSSTIKNDGTNVAIGNPTSIDATLHLKSASGLALKIETAAGIAAEIDSAGVLDYKKQFKYTFTNGGTSPLGAGKVLTSDASGNATWETFTSVSGTGLAGRIAVWSGTNSQTFGQLRDDGSTVGIGVNPTPTIALDVWTSLLIQSIRGVNGLSSSSVKKAVEGTALGSNGTNIAGYFNSYNGSSNYSVQLLDGTQQTGRFLKSVTSDGKANWADITESDISGFGTYAKVGSYTNGYIPRWNATTNTLQSGVIRDDGSQIAIGQAPISGYIATFNSSSHYVGLYSSVTGTTAEALGAYTRAVGTNANPNIGLKAQGSFGSDKNVGVLGLGNSLSSFANWLSAGEQAGGMFIGGNNGDTGVTKYGVIGVADNTGGVSGTSVGGWFHAESSTNNYAIKLTDGTEGAGKVLTSDANGNATWQIIPSSGISALVDDTTPQLGGTLDANNFNIDMGVNTITDPKVGQWQTAYGWGDHSLAGYALVGSYSAGVVPKWDSTTNTLVNGLIQDDGNRVYIIKNIGVNTSGIQQPFQVSGFVSDNDATTRLYSTARTQLSLTAQPTVTGTFSSIHAVTGSFLNVSSDSLNGYSLDFATQYNHGLANGFHIRMLKVTTGDTVGTVSGIRIEPFVIDGTATNVYGIYQVGSELNRFGGDVYTQNNLRFDGQIYQEGGIYNAGTGISVNFNFDNGNVQKYTMTGNTSVGLPSNPQDGAVYTICFTQDGTGGRNVIVWHTSFNWGDAGAPDFSTGTSNEKHYVTVIRNGSVYDAIYSGVIH